MIDIVRYDPSRKQEWNAFVADAVNATFLFDRQYMDYHSHRFADHSLLAYRKGRLVALLPAHEDGDMLRSHSGLTYGGLLTARHTTTANVLETVAYIVPYMERHGIKDGAEYLALERKRLRRCADVQERMISPEGAYPMLGRSICYRFGTLQALALAATLGSDAHPASDGAVRGAMTAVLRRQSGAENFRPDGWLHVGFNGEQHCLAETYIGYGSVYLCTAFFLPLSLPADSPFWTAPEELWTCKAGWGGADVRIDHAFWK